MSYGEIVSNGTFDVFCYHQGFGFAFQLVVAEYFGVEMTEYYIGFGLDGFRVALYGTFQKFLCFFVVVFRIVVDAFCEFVVTAESGVVGKDVEDKSFLDGLFHAVEVEGVETSFGILGSETLQCLPFRCGSECKVRAVAAHLSVFHQLF